MKKGGTLDLEKALAAPLIVLSRDSFVLLCCCGSSALALCLSARHKLTNHLQMSHETQTLWRCHVGKVLSAASYLRMLRIIMLAFQAGF